MIYNNVVLTVYDVKNVDKVINSLQRCAELSRQEAGCERLEVYQSQDHVRLFFLIEQWQSEEDLERHREGYAYQNIYLPEVLSIAARVPHLCNQVSA